MNDPSTSRFVLLGTAMFVACGAAGWMSASRKPEGVTSPAAADHPEKTAKRGPRDRGKAGIPEAVRETLATIKRGTPGERVKASIHLAQTLPISELQRWIESSWFDTGDGVERHLFTQIALDRMKKENPEDFLAWGLKAGVPDAQALLHDWASHDPGRAIDFFRSHPDQTKELEVLYTAASSDPALVWRRLQETIADGSSVPPNHHMAFALLDTIGEKLAHELEASKAELPPAWQTKVESVLVTQRLKNSFAEELANLQGRPDGWYLFKEAFGKIKIDAESLGALAELPESWRRNIAGDYPNFVTGNNAAQWLETDLGKFGISDARLDGIRHMALSYLCYQSPELALRKLQEMELNEATRSSLLSSIFSHARYHPGLADQLLGTLSDEADLKIVRDQIAARQQEATTGTQPTASEWLAKASELASGEESTIPFPLGNMAKNQAVEFTKDFHALPPDKKLNVAQQIAKVSAYNDQIDPMLLGDVVRYLVDQNIPEPEPGSGPPGALMLSSMHAVQWSLKDPDAARDWVQSLPEGEAKQWARKNLAASWNQYDPDAVAEWLKTMPSTTRSEVEGFMEKKR